MAKELEAPKKRANTRLIINNIPRRIISSGKRIVLKYNLWKMTIKKAGLPCAKNFTWQPGCPAPTFEVSSKSLNQRPQKWVQGPWLSVPASRRVWLCQIRVWTVVKELLVKFSFPFATSLCRIHARKSENKFFVQHIEFKQNYFCRQIEHFRACATGFHFVCKRRNFLHRFRFFEREFSADTLKMKKQSNLSTDHAD